MLFGLAPGRATLRSVGGGANAVLLRPPPGMSATTAVAVTAALRAPFRARLHPELAREFGPGAHAERGAKPERGT